MTTSATDQEVTYLEAIRQAVLKFNESGALSPIKQHLGDKYTYGEIRAVIASM